MKVLTRNAKPTCLNQSVKFLNAVLNAAKLDNSPRLLSVQSTERSCKLLIVGGGSGGSTVAAKFSPRLGKNNIIVVEPSEIHYYQPMFTLVGGGMKTLKDTAKPTSEILPNYAQWIKDSVFKIEPQENYVTTKNGTKINYEYLVIAAGLQLDFDKVPGLVEALALPDSGVCSNYHPDYVERTYSNLKNFKKGNLIFTFPSTPIKCAGAPQKICYIAEDYLKRNGKRNEAKFYYNTALGVIFGVKKYADSLWEICKERGIEVNLGVNLMGVDFEKKMANFESVQKPGEVKLSMEYSLLHVTPPMSSPPFLRSTTSLCDATGYVDVDRQTLIHKTFPNVFGIGDCTNLPTSKTAAAVAAQSGVLYDNLTSAMEKKELKSRYDGYTSCPLVTGYASCILAEFDYALQPLETFPFDQSRESRLMFHLKKDFMPSLYWNAMLKGYWRGPGIIRKLINFRQKKTSDVPTV